MNIISSTAAIIADRLYGATKSLTPIQAKDGVEKNKISEKSEAANNLAVVKVSYPTTLLVQFRSVRQYSVEYSKEAGSFGSNWGRINSLVARNAVA